MLRHNRSDLSHTAVTSAASITVVIAETSAFLRGELERFVSVEPTVTIVGLPSNTEQTIKALADLAPEVLILDLEMDGACDIGRTKPACTNLVFLTSHGDENQITKAIKSGCSGIARKQTFPRLIVDAIRTVHMGKLWFDPQIARDMANCALASSHRPRRNGDLSTLSEREQQIVQLVSQGHKNSGVAERAGISEQTVKNHMHNIFTKLGVSDRLDLALYAVSKGWHLNGGGAQDQDQ